jgi:GNAT superfamily N-acetyltransferase
MAIDVEKRDAPELMALHELYRAEANCQLIRDSHWARGFLNCYSIKKEGRLAGHAAVAERYDKGRVLEFYTFPEFRSDAKLFFRKFLNMSGATHVEAQSNVSLMLEMLREFATDVFTEKLLFADARTTQIVCPAKGVFRRLKWEGELPLFNQGDEPPGDWLIESERRVVATGGCLTHYNPPYADLYMEVEESQRRKGFGSYLIQELKKVCYESGKRPAARCNFENVASRATLEKAGMSVCGEVLVGAVRSNDAK